MNNQTNKNRCFASKTGYYYFFMHKRKQPWKDVSESSILHSICLSNGMLMEYVFLSMFFL